jgi:hypothetical protein
MKINEKITTNNHKIFSNISYDEMYISTHTIQKTLIHIKRNKNLHGELKWTWIVCVCV